VYNEILEFLAMGGYAVYIWPCYALLIIVLFWHLYRALITNKNLKVKLKHLYLGSNSDQHT
jgi:heme exporter protein CcmD